jgi:hypothetical protein
VIDEKSGQAYYWNQKTGELASSTVEKSHVLSRLVSRQQ